MPSIVALARWDPLARHFLRNAPIGSRVLEGGCGLAPYLALLEESGRHVVGVDFALKTLARVRRSRPGTRLVGGDVSSLPFGDGAFDIYISQGVVEHFESGPEAALAEAFRVLAPGGLLLISVPDFNPLRRLLMFCRRQRSGGGPRGGCWIRVRGHAVSAPPHGTSFFQYVYRRNSFAAILAAQGFRVVWDRGYSVLWGIQDLPAVRVLWSWIIRHRRHGAPGSVPVTPGIPATERHSLVKPEAPPGLLRTVVLREEGRGPLSRLFVRCLTETSANMRLYVARKPIPR
jgi:SAM-dependent methyltransferase